MFYPQLREVFCRYLKRYASDFFKKLIAMGTNGADRRIMDGFSSWLPALLCETLLRYVDDSNSEKRRVFGKRLVSLLTSVNLLINDAQKMKFNPYFDEQFIIDFVKLVEMIYSLPNREDIEEQLLIVANEFMALIIQSNNPCALILIQYIDFTLIGYMYHILDTYKIGDRLGNAIAHVLVAYDNLDYPLEHQIEKSLYPMSSSAYEWMMSTNPDLHVMSIILMEKLYSDCESSYCNYRNLSGSARACIVTGFMHMLCSNHEMVDNAYTRAKIMRILLFEDFRYHPLYKHLIEMVPSLQDDNEPREDLEESPPPSPDDMSFTSADTGQFDEEQMSVLKILEQLNDDEGYRSASVVSLPRNIYLNRIIEEQTLGERPGFLDWGDAQDTTQTS